MEEEFFFMPAVSFSVGNRSYKKTERCHEIIFYTVLFLFFYENKKEDLLIFHL